MLICRRTLLLCLFVGLQEAVSAFRLQARDNIIGAGNNLSDSHDIRYSTTITLNGRPFDVLIDTGSTDTFVVGNIPQAVDLGKQTTLSYVGGLVQGRIVSADMTVFSQSIPGQAIVVIEPGAADQVEGSGLIGLGPRYGSSILKAGIPSPMGLPPLDRLFRQNMSLPNFLTVNLNRGADPTNPFPGDITVGTVLPGLHDIDDAPKLPIMETSGNVNQHWQIHLDESGIIGPDGNVIQFVSGVDSNANRSQPVVILDTGFSLPQVPQSVADAFYKNITGAKLENIAAGGLGWTYTLPCTAEVNVSWVFAGQVFPMHPLDMTMDPAELQVTVPQGRERFCIGAFQPISDAAKGSTYDMILGMAWLRNVYILVNFGDFVDGTTTTADPFIQILSTTNNTAEAHQDFVKVRLGGFDTTTERWPLGKLPRNFPPPFLLAVPSSGPSQQTIIIIAVSVGGGVLLLGTILLIICLRRSKSKKRHLHPSAGVGQMFRQDASAQYKPLLHPSDSQTSERSASKQSLVPK